MVRPSISDDTWRRLNRRKRDPEETTDDVIRRLLDRTEPEVRADGGGEASADA